MNNKSFLGIVIGIVVIVLAIVGVIAFKSLPTQVAAAGVPTTGLLAENYDPYIRQAGGFQTNFPVKFNGGTSIGNSSTALNNLVATTCYIQPYATTIAASSTAQVDCQATAAVGTTNTGKDTLLTGVLTGDQVQATLSTSTAGSVSNGIAIIGASASTTNGYVSLVISNFTGTTYTWPTTGTASGTAYIIDYR